jgi:predicted RNA-binding Zn-ribbon protein involved in translation (DUF1610 family)
MVCNDCGLRWDIKDQAPPECIKGPKIVIKEAPPVREVDIEPVIVKHDNAFYGAETGRWKGKGPLMEADYAEMEAVIASDPLKYKLGRQVPKVFADKRDEILTNKAEADGHGINKVLHCPGCGVQHIDMGEWKTRLHKTHACDNCGIEWRPFNYPTRGVHNV